MSVRYSCPAISRQFRSALHDERNLELATGEADGEIVDRVLSARKPVGFAEARDARTAVAWALRAIDRDLPCSYARTPMEGVKLWTVKLTLPARPRSARWSTFPPRSATIALGSVRSVSCWRTSSGTWRISRPCRCRSFDRLRGGRDWRCCFRGARPCWGESAYCGLLLGYPLEATAALIASEQGIPGFSYDRET